MDIESLRQTQQEEQSQQKKKIQQAIFIGLFLILCLAGLYTLVRISLPKLDVTAEQGGVTAEERVAVREHLRIRIDSLSAQKARSAVGAFTITDTQFLQPGLVEVRYNDEITFYIGRMTYELTQSQRTGILNVDPTGFEIIDSARGHYPGEE